jgi:hypothetical protein
VANYVIELANGGRGSSLIKSKYYYDGERMTAQSRESVLDYVPAMSTTALALEIMLSEPSIDLGAAAELVLSDVGATLQILRLVGGEYCAVADRPSRMTDCLSSLNASEWLQAITRRTFVCDRAHLAEAALWKRCRTIAQYAQLAAESVDSVSAEDAYLVGLFHDVPAISKLLVGGGKSHVDLQTVEAAICGALPVYVSAALDCAQSKVSSQPWSFILDIARELAESSADQAYELEDELITFRKDF